MVPFSLKCAFLVAVVAHIPNFLLEKAQSNSAKRENQVSAHWSSRTRNCSDSLINYCTGTIFMNHNQCPANIVWFFLFMTYEDFENENSDKDNYRFNAEPLTQDIALKESLICQRQDVRRRSNVLTDTNTTGTLNCDYSTKAPKQFVPEVLQGSGDNVVFRHVCFQVLLWFEG